MSKGSDPRSKTDNGNARYLIAGDIHGDFRHVVAAVKQHRPDYVISVGDLEPQRPLLEEIAPLTELGTEFRFTVGNHDSDSAEVWERLDQLPTLRLCNEVSWVGNMKVAALSGVVRAEVWDPPRTYRTDAELFAGAKFENFHEYKAWLKKRTPPRVWSEDPSLLGRLRKHQTSIFPSVVKSLRKKKAHMLVTHEAGLWAHPHGWHFIDELREAMGCSMHFFGHHHCFRYRRDDRAISVGIGLRGIVDITGKVIREGELDKQRPDPQWK